MSLHRRRRITAFGASRMPTSDPRFREVLHLGEKLGRAGWDGVTGGHQGLMAAFAQGIRQGGGHVRGITLERFPTPPENHLNEEVRARDFFHRMQQLIEEADAYLVLPGGLGTLAELAMTWDLLAIRILESRPLILYGACWPAMIDALAKGLILSVDDALAMIHVCTTAEDVLHQLDRA